MYVVCFAESFENIGLSYLQGNLNLHSRTDLVIENALCKDYLTYSVLDCKFRGKRCKNSEKQLVLEFWEN